MNHWNKLTDIFGYSWDEDAIPECAADNISIAWPSIINGIEKVIDKSIGLNALDFGCGGGLFCKKLHEMGFNVTGYDESEELIKKARINTPKEITITNSSTIAAENGSYDLITSLMVFQFIDNIDSTIKNTISLMKPNALIIYAVFNPKFIMDNLNTDIFTGFTNNKTGYMELKKGVKLSVYNRTESDYREIFEKYGYEEVYNDLPNFTEEFLEKYKMPFSTESPEYLIQGFRRKIHNK